MTRSLMFFIMEMGWKALILYMVYLWATPFAGQSVLIATIIVSGIVQVTYLLSDGPTSTGKPPAKKPVVAKKEVKQ